MCRCVMLMVHQPAQPRLRGQEPVIAIVNRRDARSCLASFHVETGVIDACFSKLMYGRLHG